MSFVAARTERIRIAPNVLNIPLRPPSVVARSAASLDLLSGGRFDLALGAGGFWDAIEAMGGTRLTPGPGGHRARGGDRRDPRAVGHERAARRLHRRAAPSRARRQARTARRSRHPDLDRRLQAAHALADRAQRRRLAPVARVHAAGRPREGQRDDRRGGGIRRARSARDPPPPEHRAARRRPRRVRRSARAPRARRRHRHLHPRRRRPSAAPGLRRGGRPRACARSWPASAAIAARRTHPCARPPRSSARREGIAYDDVPAGLRAIEPGDFEYADVRATYMRGGAPGLVLQPATTQQVVEAVAFARRHPELPLALRSGGHGISGRSTNDGGIVIDLRLLSEIEVIDRSSRLVRIGAGARWMQVAAALGEYGWALSSGDYGGVGVGGLATAGGHRIPRSRARPDDRSPARRGDRARGRVHRAGGCRESRGPVLGGARRRGEHRHRHLIRVRGRRGAARSAGCSSRSRPTTSGDSSRGTAGRWRHRHAT